MNDPYVEIIFIGAIANVFTFAAHLAMVTFFNMGLSLNVRTKLETFHYDFNVFLASSYEDNFTNLFSVDCERENWKWFF